ncbi:hypothetical protein AGMMS49957_09560 [Synergistales bacterium]|nr:hypothetical protein AGMMS49957_09560 [Synergistales bacterium]
MKNTASKITSKGQITIPHYIRVKSGFKIGDAIKFEAKDDYIIMRKPKNLMDYLGFLGNAGLPDDLEELLTPDVGKSIMERE